MWIWLVAHRSHVLDMFTERMKYKCKASSVCQAGEGKLRKTNCWDSVVGPVIMSGDCYKLPQIN